MPSAVTPLKLQLSESASKSSKFRKTFTEPCEGEDAKENAGFSGLTSLNCTPRKDVTPLVSNTLANLMSHVESSHKLPEKPVSPGLAMLRSTPGRSLQEKQQILQKKHSRAKSTLKKLPVGGGVCLWPEMDSMRLRAEEVLVLILSSLLLSFATFIVFKYLHGPLLWSLNHYSGRVKAFHGTHPIISSSDTSLNNSLQKWHKDFWKLLDDIQRQFETHLHRAHFTYLLYIVIYIAAVATLLYYLVDNMIQKSRLTPKRIKVWTLLLVATATWTLLMLNLLISAQHLERAIEGSVHSLMDELVDLATKNVDLHTYHNIVTYWQVRCLPPTTKGTLTIFGIVNLRDISFYLQYYSVTVTTALCTPIVKLLLAVKEIYRKPHYFK